MLRCLRVELTVRFAVVLERRDDDVLVLGASDRDRRDGGFATGIELPELPCFGTRGFAASGGGGGFAAAGLLGLAEDTRDRAG